MKLFSGTRVFPAVLALLFAAAGAAAENRTVSITMTWQPQAQFAGIYYAKEAGIFAKYGLDVEIRHKTAELSSIQISCSQFYHGKQSLEFRSLLPVAGNSDITCRIGRRKA